MVIVWQKTSLAVLEHSRICRSYHLWCGWFEAPDAEREIHKTDVFDVHQRQHLRSPPDNPLMRFPKGTPSDLQLGLLAFLLCDNVVYSGQHISKLSNLFSELVMHYLPTPQPFLNMTLFFIPISKTSMTSVSPTVIYLDLKVNLPQVNFQFSSCDSLPSFIVTLIS